MCTASVGGSALGWDGTFIVTAVRCFKALLLNNGKAQWDSHVVALAPSTGVAQELAFLVALAGNRRLQLVNENVNVCLRPAVRHSRRLPVGAKSQRVVAAVRRRHGEHGGVRLPPPPMKQPATSTSDKSAQGNG